MGVRSLIVGGMARNGQRLHFDTFASMAEHLDRWAHTGLADPTGWEDALMVSRDWLDYSARNQALLASYGLSGPVAGRATWQLVASTTEGRGCDVASGEHGWPVRVPVTTAGSQPDPYLGGHRPTRSAVDRWEWQPVFEAAQLARRPATDALSPVELPDSLAGPDGDSEFVTAVRKTAGATIRGPLPRSQDPTALLSEAAGRLRRSHQRPPLDDTLKAQVAWLVTDRVNRASTDRPPPFDPTRLSSRERWERLQDVLDPARQLIGTLGRTIGVDLTASPLPRMQIVDDRVVPAGRRHRLPAASLEQLPVGRWVRVGPYTASEWAARGEQAAGAGAYLRLNKTAYLVAVETGSDSAAWRLEDVAARTGHGLLAAGSARTLDDARASAVAAMRDRYPALTAPAVDTSPSPAGTIGGWEQMPRAGRAAAAEMYQLTSEITLYALPAPGGRWQPAVHTPTASGLELLALQPNLEAARNHAELAGRRIERLSLVADPARSDQTIAAFAGDPNYSRVELARLVGSRLETADAARIPTATAAELVELLGAAGVTPATTVAVLAAERFEAGEVARVLPLAGVPMPDAIRVLHERWQLPRQDAAELLGATVAEMRAADCTAAEILAVRPRDVLRTLPDDPHLWTLAAGAMADGGHSLSTIVGHLAAHAPTPDAFAAGIITVADSPDALITAATQRAQPDQLAAAAEAFGLSPADIGRLLGGAVDDRTVLDTLTICCDGDTTAAATLGADVGITDAALESWRTPDVDRVVAAIRSELDLDTDALLAALPPPGPSTESDLLAQLDSLVGAGIDNTTLESAP